MSKHELEGVIVERSHHARRNLHDGRPVDLCVDHDENVDALGVARQEERLGVQPVRRHTDIRAIGNAVVAYDPGEHAVHGKGRVHVQEELGGALQIELVVDLLHRVVGRVAAAEVQVPEPGRDLPGGRTEVL